MRQKKQTSQRANEPKRTTEKRKSSNRPGVIRSVDRLSFIYCFTILSPWGTYLGRHPPSQLTTESPGILLIETSRPEIQRCQCEPRRKKPERQRTDTKNAKESTDNIAN